MKCEICGLKEAVIHVRQIQKDLVRELHICEECAQEKGLIREDESELPIANLLSGLLEGKDTPGGGEALEACPSCGLKAAEFRKQGKLGCSECFKAFEKDLRAILSQMAARPHHAGRLPRFMDGQRAPGSESQELKAMLEQAVEQEDYERAAELRDRIRKIESHV